MASVAGGIEAGAFASVADYVRAVAPSISPVLVDAASLDDIASVMSALPAAVSAHAMLECRLGSSMASSDYSIMLSAKDGGQSIAGGLQPTLRMPDYVQRDPAWAPAIAFLQRWGEPGSSFHQQFDHIWLEFDVSSNEETRFVPSVFFSPREGGRLAGAAGADARSARNLIGEAINVLGGGSLSQPDADLLQLGMEQLPAGAFLFQVGVMCARRPASLRLLLSHISPDGIASFLRTIGWSGDRERLRQEIAELAPRLDGLTYGVEIHEGVGARVGIECYIHNDDWRIARDRWPVFVDYLVQRGLCLPEKGEALLAYQGISHEGDGAEVWPSNLTGAHALFRGNVVPVLARTIHHIKLGFVDSDVVEAKAYPGVSLGWVKRG